jgi:cysteine-rich secretory family protein
VVNKIRLRAGVAWLVVGLVAASGCIGGGDLESDCRRRTELTSPPDPAAEATELVALANQARADKGLPALIADPGLTEKARSWAATMAAEARLYHSTVSDGVRSSWRKLGENVGQGSPKGVHAGFLRSPAHYANMVDPAFTHIGVGVAPDGSGARYVTEVFMEAAAATQGTPAPPLPVTTRARPAPTATLAPPPTTGAPTTTTTTSTTTSAAAAPTITSTAAAAPPASPAPTTIVQPEPLVANGQQSPCGD